MPIILGMNPRTRALQALRIDGPLEKVTAVQALCSALPRFVADGLSWCAEIDEPPGLPGRPAKPPLVPAKQVATRSPFTAAGRAALLHAVAHIEFNAINLALDAVWRFAGLPEAYYRDWLSVAADEARHFMLLSEHLQFLGVRYGDFDAHDGLWVMTQRTAHDVVARMALVPRTLEARGLDATPPMQAKFARAGDQRAVDILGMILRDEVGHVAIGNRWYRWLCQRDGLEPIQHYRCLVERYQAPGRVLLSTLKRATPRASPTRNSPC